MFFCDARVACLLILLFSTSICFSGGREGGGWLKFLTPNIILNFSLPIYYFHTTWIVFLSYFVSDSELKEEQSRRMINFYCYVHSFTLSFSLSHSSPPPLRFIFFPGSWFLLFLFLFRPFLNVFCKVGEAFGGKIILLIPQTCFPSFFLCYFWLGFIFHFFSHTCTHRESERVKTEYDIK